MSQSGKNQLYKRVVHRTRRNLRHILGRGGINDPILVYSMGKVGSSSVYHSLRQMNLDVPIYHMHYLNHLDEMEALIRRTLPHPEQTLKGHTKARAFVQEFNSPKWKRWNVITLVRTPVRRNVSSFFESIRGYYPNAADDYAAGTLTLEELKQTFLERFDHQAPKFWFDSQVKPILGIDVFAEPFPRERGYTILTTPRVHMLVLRMEDLSRCGVNAINEWLGIQTFSLSNANEGENKKYAQMYRAFTRSVALPPDYYQEMHKLIYSKHFYTPEELRTLDYFQTEPQSLS